MKSYKELRDRLLGPDKKDDLTQTQYHLLFNSPLGRKVLTHMLTELHFFDGILDDPEEIALRNYAVVLLNRIGVWNADKVEDITNNIMNINPTKKEEQE
jgi:hypothetical protein